MGLLRSRTRGTAGARKNQVQEDVHQAAAARGFSSPKSLFSSLM